MRILGRLFTCSAVTVSLGVLAVTSPAAAGPASASRPDQITSFCASTKAVTRLDVRRTDAFAQNHIHFSFPPLVVVRRASAVRKVARAVCSLPLMPSQTIHCPIGLGITYHLAFLRPDHLFRKMVLDPTGCETVHGLVRPRWVARSPRLWRILGAAMRMRNPSWATFRGTQPGASAHAPS